MIKKILQQTKMNNIEQQAQRPKDCSGIYCTPHFTRTLHVHIVSNLMYVRFHNISHMCEKVHFCISKIIKIFLLAVPYHLGIYVEAFIFNIFE